MDRGQRGVSEPLLAHQHSYPRLGSPPPAHHLVRSAHLRLGRVLAPQRCVTDHVVKDVQYEASSGLSNHFNVLMALTTCKLFENKFNGIHADHLWLAIKRHFCIHYAGNCFGSSKDNNHNLQLKRKQCQ